jgi:hypothetical protein
LDSTGHIAHQSVLEKILLMPMFVLVMEIVSLQTFVLVQMDILEMNVNSISVMEGILPMFMFVLVMEIVHLLTIVHVQMDTLEMNVNSTFVTE